MICFIPSLNEKIGQILQDQTYGTQGMMEGNKKKKRNRKIIIINKWINMNRKVHIPNKWKRDWIGYSYSLERSGKDSGGKRSNDFKIIEWGDNKCLA